MSDSTPKPSNFPPKYLVFNSHVVLLHLIKTATYCPSTILHISQSSLNVAPFSKNHKSNHPFTIQAKPLLLLRTIRITIYTTDSDSKHPMPQETAISHCHTLLQNIPIEVVRQTAPGNKQLLTARIEAFFVRYREHLVWVHGGMFLFFLAAILLPLFWLSHLKTPRHSPISQPLPTLQCGGCGFHWLCYPSFSPGVAGAACSAPWARLLNGPTKQVLNALFPAG